ncbi:unnamed protein product [Rotaria sp. Silwood2]|nr:unnamed protein product [Rotaria sp. Silwood2]
MSLEAISHNLNSSSSNNDSTQSSTTLKFATHSGEYCNSKRTKIIIISITTLLIFVILIMIVMMIFLRNSQNATDKSTLSITEDNVNSYSSTTISTIYDVGQGGASSEPPCSSYTVVNDPSRNIATYGMGGSCDNGLLFNTSIDGRWIRFMGTGGTIIPLTSPEINHCGAYLAGWFNGTLPSIVGTIVSGDVCFNTYSITGAFVSSVSVVNCGSFYVYFLPPVEVCNSRYCTI